MLALIASCETLSTLKISFSGAGPYDPLFASQRGGAIAWGVAIIVRDPLQRPIDYVSH